MIDLNSIKNKILGDGIDINSEQLSQFDFNHLIHTVSGGTVQYSGMMNDIKVKYYQSDWDDQIFEYLLTKKNSTLMYKKIQKVENLENIQVVKKTKKLSWTSRTTVLNIMDYQYQFSEYTLKGTRYNTKKSSQSDIKIKKYQEYRQEVADFSSDLFINMGANEQLQKESMPGSKYYQADELSLIIKYQNKKIGILRFKFLNKSTSYVDQGKLVSFLFSIFYMLFQQEHGLLPEFEIDIDISLDVLKGLKEIIKDFSDIDQMMIFREPKVGKVFEKYHYRYSTNYYYTHTLHSKTGIDISRGDLAEGSVLDREQELVGNHLNNDHDRYHSEVCYFNFVEAMISDGELGYFPIPKEIYTEVMDAVNENFFDSVIDQQIRMVNMIDNKVRSEKYTSKIKSCNKSPLQLAREKLEDLKKLNKKSGRGRIKDDEYNQKSTYIKNWIAILKEKKRIDPGSEFFIKMDMDDNKCEKYIIDEFSMMFPWADWKDNVVFAKNYVKFNLNSRDYRENKEDIDWFLESLFGNKSFLYRQKEGNRAVFYRSIEKQFDAYGIWEDKQRDKKKSYSPYILLKDSVKKKMIKTLKFMNK